MSTPLDVIDLSAKGVGATGSIDLKRCAPTSNPHFTNKTATLVLYNESGSGLRLTGKDTGLAFDLPAGAWIPQPVPAAETEIDYKVVYLLNSAPVSKLLATYYQPGEPVIGAVLGNSPIGLATNVPLNATATSVANDGNVTGTEFVESSVSGVKHISIQNQGFVQVLQDATSANIQVISLKDLQVGGHEWGIYIDTDHSLGFFDLTSFNTALHLLSTGAISTDNSNFHTDGSGNLTAGNDTLGSGIQESGHFVYQGQNVALTVMQFWVRFRKKMTNVPSSITLSNITTVNVSAQSASGITTDGYILNVTVGAAMSGVYSIVLDWATVGN